VLINQITRGVDWGFDANSRDQSNWLEKDLDRRSNVLAATSWENAPFSEFGVFVVQKFHDQGAQ